MEDGTDKTELRGNRVQGDWVHGKEKNKPSALGATLSRRRLIGLGTASAVGFAAKKLGLLDNVGDPRELFSKGPSEEQKEAFNIWNDLEARKKYGVARVELKQILEDGKPVAVKMMDKPSSFQSNEGSGSGLDARRIRSFKESVVFTDALRVIGTNPDVGGLRGSKDSWLYVRDPIDPDNPAKGGFINGDSFEWDPEIFDEENAVRLESFKNP